MSLFIRPVFSSIPKAAGTVDFIHPDFGNEAPKLALIIGSHVTGAGVGNFARLSWGAYDGTNQIVQTFRSRNGNTPLTTTRGATDAVLMLLANSTTSVIHEAAASAMLTNGVRLTKSATSVEAGAIAILFGGSDFQAHVTTLTANSAIAGTASVTGLSWQPNLAFVYSINSAYDDTARANAAFTQGIAIDGVQRCLTWFTESGGAVSATAGYLDTSNVGRILLAGADRTHSLAFTSDGCTLTTAGATGAQVYGIVLCRIDNHDLALTTETYPAAVGDKTFTNPNIRPAFAYNVLSTLVNANAEESDSSSGAMGISTFTEDEAYSLSVADEDDVATPNTQTAYDERAVYIWRDDSLDISEANFGEFTATGYTLGFSNTLTVARQFFSLTITGDTSENVPGPNPAPGPATPVTFQSQQRHRTRNLPVTPTVEVWSPLVQGQAPIADLTTQIESYNHTTEAFGGYWDADITIKAHPDDIEEWLEEGIGRRIVTRNPEGKIVWEGFVNQVAGNLGGLSKTVGPLLDITNRTRLVYSTIDTTGVAPVLGIRATTSTTNDEDSQDRFGIFETVLSSGGTTATLADELRDTYLAEHKEPESSEQYAFGGNEPGVQLSLLGYVRMFERYTYNSTTTGTMTSSAKIIDVIGDSPNAYFSDDFINENTLAVPAYDNDDRTAWNVIKEIVARGDASNNRWLFGVYADRQAYYNIIDDEIHYLQYLRDTRQTVTTPNGALVQPWDVRPGRWLFFPDFLIGRIATPTTLRDDPRAIFLESVTYTMSYGLAVNGNKVKRLDQKLARLGLAGIGG